LKCVTLLEKKKGCSEELYSHTSVLQETCTQQRYCDYFSNNRKRFVYLMSLPIFDLLMSHKNTSVVDSFRMNTYVVELDFPKKNQSGSDVPRNFVRGGGSTNLRT